MVGTVCRWCLPSVNDHRFPPTPINGPGTCQPLIVPPDLCQPLPSCAKTRHWMYILDLNEINVWVLDWCLQHPSKWKLPPLMFKMICFIFNHVPCLSVSALKWRKLGLRGFRHTPFFVLVKASSRLFKQVKRPYLRFVWKMVREVQ